MAERSSGAPTVKLYRVGGSVRDELLGRPVVDRDWVVVGATPEMMLASGYEPVGRDFPVFLHPDTHEEYALARTERKHGRGYRGFEFFVSPDVTLEEDLIRRDLTINAMARDENGTLIDPFGGERDLRAGVLRHVSPAFAEDPLRVLRVARFAARLGFAVAPETRKLMRGIVASGELHALAPERVWQEIARGLTAPHPSRMLVELRACGALAQVLPEVDAYIRGRPAHRTGSTLAAELGGALDCAAKAGFALAVRYAILAHDLADFEAPAGRRARAAGRERDALRRRPRARAVRIADRMSQRLRVPLDCRDAAVLAARHRDTVAQAQTLAPAALLDLLTAADALRRPERLDALIAVVTCAVPATTGGGPDSRATKFVRDALEVVKAVDAARIARALTREGGKGPGARGAARDRGKRGPIGLSVRRARLDALRAWKQSGTMPSPPADAAPER